MRKTGWAIHHWQENDIQLNGDDQIAAWRCARDSLGDGGRFVVDLTMANLAAYAESMQTPRRVGS